jgi:hypothetical protein
LRVERDKVKTDDPLFAKMMKRSEHGVMLKPRTDDMTARFNQSLDNQIEGIRCIVAKGYARRIITSKKIADLKSYSIDEFFGLNT